MGKKKEKKGKKEKKEKKKFSKPKKGTLKAPTKGSSSKQLKNEIKKLEQALRAQEALIQKLQQQSVQPDEKNRDDTAELLHRQRGGSVAVTHRKAWEQHQYLRQQYEFHLEENRPTSTARRLANRDLVERFGETAGYSAEELQDILS